MIRAVIFDMDGLMLDTEPLYQLSWKQAAAESGFTLTHEMHLRLTGKKRADSESLLRDEFGPEFSVERFRTACRKFEDSVFSTGPAPKKPGLDGLLMLLETWQIPKAVATSSERRRAVSQLEKTGLYNRFNAVVAGDEVANGKPAPDIFLLAAQRLGIAASACLVLEDSEPGVIAARRAGMLVYLVPDFKPASAAAEKIASATFDSLGAVALHLERENAFRQAD